MKIKRQKVLDALKIKAYDLGFSEEELGKVADKIVNGNEVPDDADDAKINEVVNNSIDSVIDYLSLAQAASQRIISKYKKRQEEEAEKKEKEKEKPVGTKTEPTTKKNPENEEEDDVKSLLKGLAKKIDDFETKTNERFEKINTANIAETRLDRIKSALKDSGDFGEKTLRDFKRMSFADDDDFNSYLKEISDDAQAYITKTSQEGLRNTPPKSNPNKKDVKVASDEECKALADSLSI